ncbi:MAG: UDP-N-acetylmuramate dehydrogenase [Pseudomonadota bacterium]
MFHSNDDLIVDLPKIRGQYRLNSDLSKINWFNVGGNADLVFRPDDVDDLAYFIKNKPDNIPVTMIGVGSNLLIRDNGIRGVVIRLGRNFAQIKKLPHDPNIIIAGAASLDFNVAEFAMNNNLSGCEFLTGIPGTIGGAIAMNAGCYNADMAQIVEKVHAIDNYGTQITLTPSQMGFIYRGNTVPDDMIFTAVELGTITADKFEIAEKMRYIKEKRANTQPINSKTSGSTFQNPPGLQAWKLIDDAGCRGLTIGGAMVSEKHCNFFINKGNAKAKDIEDLILEVTNRVYENSGIKLEAEIKIIGDVY